MTWRYSTRHELAAGVQRQRPSPMQGKSRGTQGRKSIPESGCGRLRHADHGNPTCGTSYGCPTDNLLEVQNPTPGQRNTLRPEHGTEMRCVRSAPQLFL